MAYSKLPRQNRGISFGASTRKEAAQTIANTERFRTYLHVLNIIDFFLWMKHIDMLFNFLVPYVSIIFVIRLFVIWFHSLKLLHRQWFNNTIRSCLALDCQILCFDIDHFYFRRKVSADPLSAVDQWYIYRFLFQMWYDSIDLMFWFIKSLLLFIWFPIGFIINISNIVVDTCVDWFSVFLKSRVRLFTYSSEKIGFIVCHWTVYKF